MSRRIDFPTSGVYLFDVDGTLYSQKRLHILIGIEMLGYYVRHIREIADLSIVFQFRRLREKDEYKKYTIEGLIKIIAQRRHVQKAHVCEVIDQWLFKRPLPLIAKCAYDDVLQFMKKVTDNSGMVAVYSDYPAEDKLRALGVTPTFVFSAEDEGIGELKPSRKAMHHILDRLDVSADSCIYVGDRDSRDRCSAEYAGIKYFDISEFRKCIRRAEFGKKERDMPWLRKLERD